MPGDQTQNNPSVHNAVYDEYFLLNVNAALKDKKANDPKFASQSPNDQGYKDTVLQEIHTEAKKQANASVERYKIAWNFHYEAEVAKKRTYDARYNSCFSTDPPPSAAELAYKKTEEDKMRELVNSYVDAIDLTNPVEIVNFNPGEVVAQRTNTIIHDCVMMRMEVKEEEKGLMSVPPSIADIKELEKQYPGQNNLLILKQGQLYYVKHHKDNEEPVIQKIDIPPSAKNQQRYDYAILVARINKNPEPHISSYKTNHALISSVTGHSQKHHEWHGRWNVSLKDAFTSDSSKVGSASSSLVSVTEAFNSEEKSMKRAVLKHPFYMMVTEPTKGLKSTAKKAVPTWDYQVNEEGQIRKTKYVAKGGGEQIFIPETNKMKRLHQSDPEYRSKVIEPYVVQPGLEKWKERAATKLQNMRGELQTGRENKTDEYKGPKMGR
jgi:hypothetical protein